MAILLAFSVATTSTYLSRLSRGTRSVEIDADDHFRFAVYWNGDWLLYHAFDWEGHAPREVEFHAFGISIRRQPEIFPLLPHPGEPRVAITETSGEGYLQISGRWWWILIINALPLLIATVLLRRMIRSRTIHFGHCPACGYDLRASPERCPECGTLVSV